MSSPATGLLVYNTNSTTGLGFYYWDGSDLFMSNPEENGNSTMFRFCTDKVVNLFKKEKIKNIEFILYCVLLSKAFCTVLEVNIFIVGILFLNRL